jgi:hypothetical protein
VLAYNITTANLQAALQALSTINSGNCSVIGLPGQLYGVTFNGSFCSAAAAGVPTIVCFSGNRGGRGDAAGVGNCIVGLKRLAPLAEAAGELIKEAMH